MNYSIFLASVLLGSVQGENEKTFLLDGDLSTTTL